MIDNERLVELTESYLKSLVRAAAGIAARERQLDQAALVCDLDLGRSIGGASIEFHYPRGPFTLVPAGGNRANLVWIDDRAALETAKAGGEATLLAAFNDKSQRLFGKIALASPAFVFPLSTLSVDQAGMSAGSAYKEGTTLAPTPSNNNQSYERKPGGPSGNSLDTDNNGNDFLFNNASSNPQNQSSLCLGATPTRTDTWGRVKSFYR